jgi:hypothetical protein
MVFRKLLASVAAVLGFVSVSCFAQPMFLPVESTPYDRQMARVQPVLASVPNQPAEAVPLAAVNHWMSKLRGIRYRYSLLWETPSEVRASRFADCKGKALTLYEIMQSMGATNLRLVIGKYRARDFFTHTWLEWSTPDGNYILDPTFYRAVTKEVPHSDSYLPLYAYDGEHKYRIFDVTFVTQN